MNERVRSRDKKKGDSERSEQAFLDSIEGLRRTGAGELAERWETEYTALIDAHAAPTALEELFARFAEFKKKRETALLSIEVLKGVDEELIDEIKAFDRNVVLSFGNASLFQGNGATAEVYEMLGHPHMCVKFIINQAMYNENNHLRTEFSLLRSMSDVRCGNVRAPIPYFLRVHPVEGHSFGMEKVDGKSLSQILEKPHENEGLITIARSLNRQQVLSELTEYVNIMHERGITHNDLRKRNIMLDREGHVFVIDFGKAKRNEIEAAQGLHRESDLTYVQGEVLSFFQEVDKLGESGYHS